MSDLFRETPIETHRLGGESVFVKREDLCSVDPMPPLAKMRGVSRYMEARAIPGATFAILDTRLSKSGQGVAVIASRLGVRCRYYFPRLKSQVDLLPQWEVAGRQEGTTLVPMVASKIGIVRARALRDANENGAEMIPFGLPLFETVLATADVVETVPEELLRGTIALSTGTATIASGICAGLLRRGILPERVLGISCSMSTAKQRKTLVSHLCRFIHEEVIPKEKAVELLGRLRLVRGPGDYYEPGRYSAPWPTHPYYEAKALDVLVPMLPRLRSPVLFWNIGA
jgi:hypothetical protein